MNNERPSINQNYPEYSYKLTPFKLFTLQNFPYIEADFDAITNYQLFCKVVDYLNEVIANENTVESIVQQQIDNINVLYNWFNELDVQVEINNKLDDMVEDGTFDSLITEILQPYINNINEKLNEQDEKISIIESGSPLVASSISGMTNTSRVYVNTSDGNWYYYNGTGWEIGGQYQSTGIGYQEIAQTMLKNNSATKQKQTNSIIENGFFDDWRFGNRSVEYTQDRIDAYLQAEINGLKTKGDNNDALLWCLTKDILKVTQYPHVEFDYNVDISDNSGCLIGYSNSNDVSVVGQSNTSKLMWGYHPTRGFCMYDGNIPNFVTYENKENIQSGTYHFKLDTDINKKTTLNITCETLDYNKTFNVSFRGNPDFLNYIYGYIQLTCKDSNKYITNVKLIDNEFINSNLIINSKLIKYNDYGKQAGRNVFVYHFGGNGNDWCFVRTPDTYNPLREKPYPFVICNHGNGWVMNGSLSRANWTKRTMYVEASDPDYIANPTQYNLVPENHPEYLYSNPTIEALLSAGYIVCGCENYGDLLYGNNNCRNACVDFFYHMVNNYNVEDRCYMIGASNGAQTSINASYILNGKIKAMILQYPLTCLVNQYFSNQNQQNGIRNAYNITNENVTRDELISITRTHDFLNTNIIDNKKTGYFPPTKVYYSTTDTVVNYNQNTIPFKNLLETSLKVIETVQVDSDNETREHGDYAHFDPSGFVEWFNTN